MQPNFNEIDTLLNSDPIAGYQRVQTALAALWQGERNHIANLANTSALLFCHLGKLNWAGFYLYDGHELVVGPFQGKPACVRIALGRGVCGHAAVTGQTQIVPDVHAFADHIACDAASQSEIVIPLYKDKRLLGVLDLDSPVLGRFTTADATGLGAITTALISACDWPV